MKQTYRRVVTSFWTDSDVRRVARKSGHPIEARLLLSYLFTGPDSTLSGLYFQEPELMASRTGVPLELVEELLRLFEGEFLFYDWTTLEVFVRRAWHHQVGPEAKPKDNRWAALVRSVADAESDRLVGRLVYEYPDFPWPKDVLSRIPGYVENSEERVEAPLKPLPPNNDGPSGGFSTPSETRGSEVTHAHALAITHTREETTPPYPPHPDPADDPEAVQHSPKLTVSDGGGGEPEGDRDQEDKLWLEAKKAAYEELALGRLDYRDERANVSILSRWRHHERRDPEDVLAAIRGTCLLRRDGQMQGWLEPNEPASLRVLVRSDCLLELNGEKVQRKLWGAAIDRYRAELRGNDPRERRPSSGLMRVRVSL